MRPVGDRSSRDGMRGVEAASSRRVDDGEMVDDTPAPAGRDSRQRAPRGLPGALERWIEHPVTYWTLSVVSVVSGVTAAVLAIVDYGLLRATAQVVDLRSLGFVPGFVAMLGARSDAARVPVLLAGVGALLGLILLAVGMVRWLVEQAG